MNSLSFLLVAALAVLVSDNDSITKTGENLEPKVVSKQTDFSYANAFKKAQASDRPLVVIVTATWCAPCQVMKNQTIKQVMDKDGFENVILAFVDVDQEPSLAQNLTKGKGIPHVVVFEKRETQWKRRTLFGVQTAETLQSFIKPKFIDGSDRPITRIADISEGIRR